MCQKEQKKRRSNGGRERDSLLISKRNLQARLKDYTRLSKQVNQDWPLLVWWVLNDGLLSVNDVLLQLMWQHPWETHTARMVNIGGRRHCKVTSTAVSNLKSGTRTDRQTDRLTFNWWTFERLGNLVPGFCDLSVLQWSKDVVVLNFNQQSIICD